MLFFTKINDYINNRETPTVDDVYNMMLALTEGVKAIHDKGYAHRDIKPENIIIYSYSEKIIVPKLANFGFALIKATENPKVIISGSKS